MTARPSPKVYLRNGAEVFFDPCRCVLVPATPEEQVRQRFVAYLIAELGVPAEWLRTEAHLSHFVEGLSGRAAPTLRTREGLRVVDSGIRDTSLGNDRARLRLAQRA